ncbi:nitroreductase family protein [Paenalcaligenes hominis]|uniref:nitroreductase family protein n=1 Tax=Paenalcaligenes hominis TaxID=643674 RepID=UPI003524CFF9
MPINSFGGVSAAKTLSFYDTVRARQSCRSFAATAVDPAQIREVLEDAKWAPSNCNIQPWQVHIVSGAKRDELAQTILIAAEKGKFCLDFSFDDELFDGRYGERRREQGVFITEVLV